ncbi:Transcription factor GRAS domain-containing protein [Dioscorea alata]|uniref:Transcription factor GRAS domain-containing protein n=1 Tax=Dioscorea alata TaxID=55571 RepID=A0ACB7VPW3_DIOAL|nr:Transcription factor GRAS domain-containing protein [Dioscorea alata]
MANNVMKNFQSGYCQRMSTNSELSSECSNGDLYGDFWSSYGFCHESPSDHQSYVPEFMGIDHDMHFDMVSAAYHLVEKPKSGFQEVDDLEKSLESEICELLGPNNSKSMPVSFPYFDIINGDGQQSELQSCSNGEEITEHMDEGRGGLSTEEVMKIAAAHYIQFSTDPDGESSILMHSMSLTYAGLNSDEIKNVELAGLLLAAAEKASNQQYDRSSNLLRQCMALSSSTGNTVQRVVHYFSDALQERIDQETGRCSFKGSKNSGVPGEDVIRRMLSNHPVQLIMHQKLPFAQLLECPSIQTILESVELVTRVHVIDLSIKHGTPWTLLMQALATRSNPVEYLKISAVGSSEKAISETGKWLKDFAETLNIVLDFKTVIVPNVKELKEDMFEIKEDEAIAVYSAFVVNTMVVKPESLENLLRVIRRLKPCIMTVVDVEANHNSPNFITRFTESLFYFSAFFDCIDSCMDEDDPYRMHLEGNDFSQGIRSIVATEGEERVVRHVGIGVWRSFFARFGMVEVEHSEWSKYQANLLVKQLPQGSSCNFGRNGKSLVIKWKGTPLHFISAWRFN